MATAAVTASVEDGFAGLPALRNAWGSLFREYCSEPSSSFEWTMALLRHHLRPDDRCFVVRLQRAGTLVGIVPLVCRSLRVLGQPIRLLAPVSEQYNTHSDLLIDASDAGVVKAFVDVLPKVPTRWDCFRLARLLEGHPLVGALQRELSASGQLQWQRQGLPAYVLDLPSSYDEYLAARSAKFRNHLKRVERKLHDAGAVAIQDVAATRDPDAAYEAVLHIEQRSWKQGHGSSITAVERQTGFYRDLATGALEAGRLHLQWLTLDGHPAAYNLGYLTARGYHYLKTSYDHGYRALSPSTWLRARLIQSLIERGVSRFDFPGEPYAWETQWTSDVRWRVVLSVYARTVRGRLLAAADRWKHRGDHRQVRHVDPRRPHAHTAREMAFA